MSNTQLPIQVQILHFESETDYNLYKDLRKYFQYDKFAGIDKDPDEVALIDENSNIYKLNEIIAVYECQGPKQCKCELYTVRVPNVKGNLVFSFLSKGGHDPWHIDAVDADKLEKFLLDDHTVNKDSRRKIEDIREELRNKYPF